MKCGNCGEPAKKVISVLPNERVDDSRNAPNLVMKCKSCERVGSVTVTTDIGKPLTDALSEYRESAAPLFNLTAKDSILWNLCSIMYGRLNLLLEPKLRTLTCLMENLMNMMRRENVQLPKTTLVLLLRRKSVVANIQVLYMENNSLARALFGRYFTF